LGEGAKRAGKPKGNLKERKTIQREGDLGGNALKLEEQEKSLEGREKVRSQSGGALKEKEANRK